MMDPRAAAKVWLSRDPLRHTYATMLYDAGVDVKSAHKLLGRSDMQVTLKIYTHLPDGKERATADAINKRFEEASTQ